MQPLTREAVSYAWRQLLIRAGADPETLPVTLNYDEKVNLSSRPHVIIRPCTIRAAETLLERAPNTLDWVPASGVVPAGGVLPFDDLVPVLFWGKGAEHGDRPFAILHTDGSIEFCADLIATVFFMLTRWEEMMVATRDKHGRFPGTASVAYKQGFLDRPVVDEYALILSEWLRVILPGWEPRTRAFSVKLSHDVDHVRRFANAHSAIRTLGGNLLKRHSPSLAWQTGRDAFQEMVAPEQAAHFQGIEFLSELSQKHGMGHDAFYFMATEPGPLENDYRLDSPMIRQSIEDLREQGFEIGLHAGYHTPNDSGQLMKEKAKLDAILGQTHYGGRQHYLRFQVPETWRHLEKAGLSYDSTMAFPDHEGFRCGTCHPFRPFDVDQNRELNLWELPLLVMDRTLSQYRGLSPATGEMAILALAQRCQLVGGTFTLLWHNSSLDGDWRPWVEVYQRVLSSLAQMSPCASSLAGDAGKPAHGIGVRGSRQ